MGQTGHFSFSLSYRKKKKLEASEREKRLFLEESVAARFFFLFLVFAPPEKRNRKNLEIISTKTDITEKECDFDQTEKKCHNRKCQKMSENSDNVPYIGSHKVLNKKKIERI